MPYADHGLSCRSVSASLGPRRAFAARASRRCATVAGGLLFFAAWSARSDTFPTGAFNGMQIVYTVTGAQLGDPSDVHGFSTTRTLKGFSSADEVTFSASLISAWAGFKADIEVHCNSESLVLSRVTGPINRTCNYRVRFTDDVQSASLFCRVKLLPTQQGGFVEPRYLDLTIVVTKVPAMQEMQLTRRDPLPDAKCVDPAYPVTLRFSRQVEPSTAGSGTIVFSYPTNPLTTIPCRFTVQGSTVTCRPALSTVGKLVRVTVKGGTSGIRGSRGEVLPADRTWLFTTLPALTVGIVPVQVAEGTALVKDKPGVTRVKAFWPESEGSLVSDVVKLTADVSITYDGTRTFARKAHDFYRFDLDTRKPSRVPPAAARKGNAAVFYSSRGEMPILDTMGAHTIHASIKPVGSFGQNRSYTNTVTATVRKHNVSWVSAYDGYSALLVPVNLGGWAAGETRSTAALGHETQQVLETLLPTPRARVEAQDTVWDLHYGAVPPVITDFVINNILRNLSRYGRLRHDAIVGVVPHDFLVKALGARGITGDILWSFAHRAAFVSERGPGFVVAHELGHTLQAGHSPDDVAVRGYDIRHDRYVSNANPFYGYRYDLMHADIVVATNDPDSVWVAPASYQTFLAKLTTSGGWLDDARTTRDSFSTLTADPAGTVFVDVALYESGGVVTGAIDSVFVGEESRDVTAVGAGTCSVRMEDAAGVPLGAVAFEPDWRTNETDGTGYAFFLAELPAVAGAARVVLSRGTVSLAERETSASPPVVAVTAPVAGAGITGVVDVTWTASDADADRLTFLVFHSCDGGQQWFPAAIGLTNATSFALDTAEFPGGQRCCVKVVANDGFHTVAATSGVFTVRNPPRVRYTTPANGQTGSAAGATIAAVFRDPLDAATVTSNALCLFTTATNPIPGTVSYDTETSTLVFVPDEPLRSQTNYLARLSADDLRDAFGQPLAAALDWSFAAAPDTTPPSYTALGPEPDDYGVPRRQILFAAFDEPLDASSVSNAGFRLRRTDSGASVAGTIEYDAAGHAARFTPAVPLVANTSYTALLSGELRDLAGNRMDATDWEWTFTTGDSLDALGVRVLDYRDCTFEDTNDDGLWDRLVVYFGVEILADGTYALTGSLLDRNGNTPLATNLQGSVELAAGIRTLPLVFDGATLRATRPLNPTARLAAIAAVNLENMLHSDLLADTNILIPIPTDADGDGIEDAWEMAHGLDPDDPDDGDADRDGDHLSNRAEFELGFDVDNPDMDGDTLPDGWEVAYGLNPTSPPPAWIRDVPLTRIGGADTPGECRDVAIQGNMAYVADGMSGMTVIDITNPTNPVARGRCDTPWYADALDAAYPLVFVADQNSGVQIIDAGDPDHPVIRAAYDTPGVAFDVAAGPSNLAFVADYNGGLRIIDASTPTAPVARGTLPAMGQCWGVDCAGSLVYLADRPYLRVIDTTNPDAPVQLGITNASPALTRITVRGHRAYLTCGQDLLIADVSDPTRPSVLGTVTRSRSSLGVDAVGDLVFVAGWTRLEVWDASVPAALLMRTETTADSSPRDLVATETHLFVADNLGGLSVYAWYVEDSDRDGLPDAWERRHFGSLAQGPGGDPDHDGLSTWGEYEAGLNPDAFDENGNGRSDGDDIAVGRLDPSGSDRDGDALADSEELLSIGTDPRNPDTDGDGMPDGWEHAAGLDPLNPADAAADPDKDFLSNHDEYLDGLNPFKPDTDGDTLPDGWEVHYGFDPLVAATPPIAGLTSTLVSSRAEQYYAQDVTIVSNRAYALSSSALEILDVTDPANPSGLGAWYTGGSRVHVVGTHAYLAGPYATWNILDVSDPAAPVQLGGAAAPGNAADLAVVSSRVYVAGTSGLHIYDAGNPAAPVLTVTVASLDASYGLDAHDDTVFLADGTAGLRIFDTSVLSAPRQLGVYKTAAQAYCVTVVSNTAYVSDYGYGLRIVNVANPASPMLLGSYIPYVNVADIRVEDTRAYLACAGGGVLVMDVSDPRTPTLLHTVAAPATGRAVDIRGSYLFAACTWSALHVFRLDPLDADRDGMPDAWENAYFGNAAPGALDDAEPDRLANGAEYTIGSVPTDDDQNANGILDGDEVWNYLMDPRAGDGDVDGDGVSNLDEVLTHHTNPGLADTDADGMPDGWELAYGLDPLRAADAGEDADGDRLSNLTEFLRGTRPDVADSDGDTLPDGWETHYGFDALSPTGRIDEVALYPRGFLELPGRIRDLAAVPGYVCVAGELPGIGVVDVRNPAEPVLLGWAAGSQAADWICARSNMAYAVAYNSGLQVVDLRQWTNAARVGYAATPDGGNGNVAAVSGAAFVSSLYGYGLRVFDLSDPAAPSQSALLGTLLATWLYADGTHLHTMVQVRNEYWQWVYTYRIFDVSAPTTPVELGSCAAPSTACIDIVGNGTFTFASHGFDGIRVFDVSQPTNPALVARLDLLPTATDLAVGDGLLFAACTTSGVRVADVRDAPHPYECGRADVGGDARVIAACSNIVCVGVLDGAYHRLVVFQAERIDTDEDGLPDWWERLYFGSLAAGSDDDGDRDGITNLGEYRARLDPLSADQDQDGVPDGDELRLHGTQPTAADTDGDGLDDYEELHAAADGYVTDPTNPDTDGDGLNDGFESLPSPGWPASNPRLRDTDGDGADDFEEYVAGTNPRDETDRFRLVACLPGAGAAPILRWSSVAGRKYRLQRSASLRPEAWGSVGTWATGTPPVSTLVDTAAPTDTPCYYRVRTRR